VGNEKLKSDLRRAGLTEAEIAAAIEVGDEM
jgi:AhpD family alkylhydroperoxidase